MTDFSKQSGYVAITSAIIISVLLIVITATLSYSGFFARFTVLETEFKKESVAYSETCVDLARIAIVNQAGFTTSGVNENLDSDYSNTECSYTVAFDGSQYTIQAESDYKDAKTFVRAIVTRSTTDVPIVSWKELSNF